MRYPARPLLPDHTIWHAADTAAAFAGASRGGSAPALLQFHMGPVQAYIEAARPLRDLWTGSAILLWVTFEAMRPILESVGPAAFTSPSLRGNPMVDRWLRSKVGGCLQKLIDEPDEKALKQPSLPNVFTALVPAEEGEALAAEVERSLRVGWKGLADDVKESLQKEFGEIYSGWSRNWDAQIESYFEVRTAVVPVCH